MSSTSTPPTSSKSDVTLAPDVVAVDVEAAVLGAPERAGGSGGAAVGRVSATGDAATRLAGVRVLVGPVDACGECEACRRGKLLACAGVKLLGRDTPGALGGTVTARVRWVCPLDGPLEGAVAGPSAAALPREALALYTLHARAGVGPGDPVVWLGDDPLAKLGATLARAAGGVVVTPPEGDDVRATARLVDEELRAAGARRVAWTVLDARGTAAGRTRALALAAEGGGGGGTTALLAGPALGVPDGDASLAAALAVEVRVIAVAAPHPDLLPELVALVQKGVVDLAPHVAITPWAARDAAQADRVVVVAR